MRWFRKISVRNVAGNALSIYNTSYTGVFKGSDILGYIGTGVAIGGALFGGLAAAQVGAKPSHVRWT